MTRASLIAIAATTVAVCGTTATAVISAKRDLHRVMLPRAIRTYPTTGRMSALPAQRPVDPSLISRAGDATARADTALLWIALEAEREVAAGRLSAVPTLAAAKLASGRRVEAIRLLEQAAARGGDALIWSDLAAAHLAAPSLDTNVRALDAAARAYEMSPARPEVQFNYATALQAVGLTRVSRRAWEAYGAVERSADWRNVAASNAARLLGEPTRIDGLALRRRAEAALESWSRSRAVGALAEATRLARDHASRFQDRFLTAVCDAANGPRAAAIATGWRALMHARSESDALRFPEASRQVQIARRAFTGFPAGELAAEYLRAVIEYQTGALEPSEARAGQVAGRLAGREYRQLEARTQWLLAIIETTRGRHSRALERFSRSQIMLAGLDEPENELTVRSLRADALRQLGDVTGSWRAHQAVLLEADRIDHPHRRQAVFLTAGLAASTLGHPYAARLLLDEYVETARALGAAAAIAEAYLNRLNTVGADWSPDLQKREILEIERVAQDVREPDRQAFILARTALYRARTSDPAGARDLADAATGHITRSGRRFLLPEALRLRARGHVAQRSLGAAESDLRLGIEEFERQRATIADTPYRVSFFDTGLGLYEDLIHLLIGQGRLDEAFTVFDRSRARAFGGRHEPTKAGSELTALQGRLPGDATALVYMALRDRLAIWRVTRGDVRLLDAGDSLAAVTRRVTAWHASVEQPPTALTEQALVSIGAELFDALVRPAWPLAARVIVVPDGPLHAVPFAALHDRASGTFLVETASVVLSPGPSTVDVNWERAPASVLAVGAPRVSGDVYAFLPHLPEASREIRDITALYPVRQVLTGEAATTRATLDAVAGADAVHFATHAVAHPENADLSYLLLTEDGGDDGRLTARKLRDVTWHRPSIVVLAACGTATGPHSRSEGAMGLSRALLVAGVPRVVATLWDIDDRASRDLLVRFHRLLREGRDPVEALRLSQAEMIRTQHVSQWSAFAIYAARRTAETQQEVP